MKLERCKNCDGLMEVKDGPSRGRRKECCSQACRKAWSRRTHGNEKTPPQDHQCMQTQQDTDDPPPKALPVPAASPLSTLLPVATTPRRRFQHELVQEQGHYHCSICGWVWDELPIRNCPGMPMFAQETRPAHLLTLDELKQRRLCPGEQPMPFPDAVVYTEKAPGWKPLYDLRKVQSGSAVCLKGACEPQAS